MKVNNFLVEIGDILQEDFSYEVLWTKTELLYYLAQVIREFSMLTGVVDRSRVRLVNATTGEATVPSDFNRAYYILFDQHYKDIVQVSELDFIDDDWLIGGTATTPQASTVFGSGSNAKIRFVPVPSTVTGAYGSSVITTPTLADSGSVVWTLTVSTLGAIVSSIVGTSGLTIVLSGPSTYWDLTISTAGVLITTASAATAGDTIYLVASNSIIWSVLTTDLGVIDTKAISYGLAVHTTLDDVDQTFTAGDNSTNANYGVIVDTYATGVSTTPDAVARMNSPIGITIYDRTSDDAAFIWYKGHVEPVPTIDSELFLSGALLPIVKHGVLSLAFSHDGDGQDLNKAKILRAIFIAECTAVKQMFERR